MIYKVLVKNKSDLENVMQSLIAIGVVIESKIVLSGVLLVRWYGEEQELYLPGVKSVESERQIKAL